MTTEEAKTERALRDAFEARERAEIRFYQAEAVVRLAQRRVREAAEGMARSNAAYALEGSVIDLRVSRRAVRDAHRQVLKLRKEGGA